MRSKFWCAFAAVLAFIFVPLGIAAICALVCWLINQIPREYLDTVMVCICFGFIFICIGLPSAYAVYESCNSKRGNRS